MLKTARIWQTEIILQPTKYTQICSVWTICGFQNTEFTGCPAHGLIYYKHRNQSKMPSSKKFNVPVNGLCGRCLWYPHPLTHCMRTCTYSHREGREGVRKTREKVRGATVHKAGSKIPTWLNISPVYKLWYWTPAAKSLYGSIILDDDISLWCLHR